MKNLSGLWLASNQISDISPLKGLKSLTVLYLGNNQISDISPLKGLKSLTDLWIENNPLQIPPKEIASQGINNPKLLPPDR